MESQVSSIIMKIAILLKAVNSDYMFKITTMMMIMMMTMNLACTKLNSILISIP